MRIGLLGDTHGYVPALEAAIAGCRKARVDLIVHCGDFLSTPFSPDPPDETIALLRAEQVRCIYGNGEIYLMHWGTPQWEPTIQQRRRRPDPVEFLALVEAGQRALSPENLAWLRALKGEMLIDAARSGDVYMCHSMPGDPFNGIWDAFSLGSDGVMRPDPRYTPSWRAGELEKTFSAPSVANADLILCGHVPFPLVMRTPLPHGRHALVVRGVGYMPGKEDGSEWMVDYWILENVGPASLGFRAWSLQREMQEFRPRDPSLRAGQGRPVDPGG